MYNLFNKYNYLNIFSSSLTKSNPLFFAWQAVKPSSPPHVSPFRPKKKRTNAINLIYTLFAIQKRTVWYDAFVILLNNKELPKPCYTQKTEKRKIYRHLDFRKTIYKTNTRVKHNLILYSYTKFQAKKQSKPANIYLLQ